VFNKIANGVLFDVVCRPYQGVLYFEFQIIQEIYKVWAGIHFYLQVKYDRVSFHENLADCLVADTR
jgi:hypothetical protein